MGIEKNNKNTNEQNLKLKQWIKGSLITICSAIVVSGAYTIFDINVPEHRFTDLALAKKELSQNGITIDYR